ncbi:MAG TPA: hydrogenase accessory protein HypB [Firmicutes bacterium]|nr:hydrogenase accessory protein HypB [Bacillota bacterium]
MAEIKIVKKVLAANDAIADMNKKYFDEKKILTINIMSSPGSGKTMLLEKTIIKLKDKYKIGVIEGDVSTTNDAERLQKLGVEVIQINTDAFGGDCHLEAEWIKDAYEQLNDTDLDILFVENVGNLVCPAEFKTGTDFNVVVLSTTEGEDKPVKYPLMFRVSQIMIINKIDLLPHLDIDKNKMEDNAKRINSEIQIFSLSAKTEEGLDQFIDWLIKQIKK